MHTTFIGSRKPLSISSTRIGAVGWKRFLPLTSASIRPNSGHRGWALGLRSRYMRGTRRDGTGLVWLRARSAVAPIAVHRAWRSTHHSHSHAAPVTNVHLSFGLSGVARASARLPKNDGTKSPHLVPALPSVRTDVLHRASVPAVRTSSKIVHRLRVDRVRREMESRRIENTFRIDNHRINRAETQSLAHSITVRVRRIEELPRRSASQELSRMVTPVQPVLRQATPQHRLAETQHIAAETPRTEPPKSAATPLNLDAIADSVMRQIDRRLVAHRERVGRI